MNNGKLSNLMNKIFYIHPERVPNPDGNTELYVNRGAKNILHPFWNIIAIILPQVILLIYLAGIYGDIRSLLGEDVRLFCVAYYFCLAVQTLFVTVYTAVLWVRREENCLIFLLVNMVLYAAFTYVFFYLFLSVIDGEVPGWILQPFEGLLTVLTFFMPVFIFSIGSVIARLSRNRKTPRTWPHFAGALAVPAGYYLFFQIILPALRHGIYPEWGIHVVFIAVLLTTLLFFFLLFRGGYLFFKKKSSLLVKWRTAGLLVSALVLPVASLLLYRLGRHFMFPFQMLIGDFGSVWFLILAAVNGVLLVIPTNSQGPGSSLAKFLGMKKPAVRLVLFFLRAAAFPFTFYFFLAFLPFFPVSVLFIVAVGLGILMLLPVLLMVIHVRILAVDFIFLYKRIKWQKIAVFFIPALLILPGAVTGGYYYSRYNLHRALDYLYAGNYESGESAVNRALLKESLTAMKNQGNTVRLPFLKSLYRTIVFDNLQLAEEKLSLVEWVFFNEPPGNTDRNLPDTVTESSGIVLSQIIKDSVYDIDRDCWISTVELELYNEEAIQNEYRTSIILPEGAFITDYFLDVNGRREQGLLVEKSSAQWVYNSIVSRRRDPGIIYYNSDGSLSLRVFPFAGKETRRTGFTVMHKGEVSLELSGRKVKLGYNDNWQDKIALVEREYLYISREVKKQLPSMVRKPVYHFILDSTKTGEVNSGIYEEMMEKFMTANDIAGHDAVVHSASYFFKTTGYTGDWQRIYRNFPAGGAVFLDRIIRAILTGHYRKNDQTFPVIIFLNPTGNNAVPYQRNDAFAHTLPDTGYFYELGAGSILKRFALFSGSVEEGADGLVVDKITGPEKVLIWPHRRQPLVFLRNNYDPIIINIPKPKNTHHLAVVTNTPEAQTEWESGVKLIGMWRDLNLYPRNYENKFKGMYVSGLKHTVLSHITSFIVVENDAQKRALLRKQEQVLKGRKIFTPLENREPMSEPGVVIFVLAVVFLVGRYVFFRRKKFKSQ